MEYRILRGHEVKDAVILIHNTFLEDIAPYYDEDAVKVFIEVNSEENFLLEMKENKFILIGAFDERLVGVAGIVDFKHLRTLFIDKQYQSQKIGTELLKRIKNFVNGDLSVNATPKAVSFYQHNGFVPIAKEQWKSGMSFVPMVYHSYNENKFEDYNQVHEFISMQKDRVYALDNFKRFMNDLCNPQCLLKTIHIGGTNGKGSTTNYIRSVLQREGYTVATFTSPTLISRLEVMRINDKNIKDFEVIQYANRYMSMWLEYELSMFEIEVFIAIMYFLNNKVDFAVFEVGLGGELDATNIVWPIIAANTNIGLDHTEYLGDTYEKIAYTKGGIIKDGIPFISGETKKECIQVFESLCQKHQSPFLQVLPTLHIHDDNNSVTFDYRDYHITLNTSARYQSQNSALAIEILLYLKNNGYISLDDHNLLEGLKEATWAGRFEIVNNQPLMIIDGAHNREGIEAFYQSAKKYTNIKIIFSALRDKDTHAMLQKLLELTDDVTVCEFDFYRAQDAQLLAENFPVQVEKNWQKAVDEAFLHKGVVFITGSLYFIAQVRPY
ncbi:MAG: GNAT family N-acetyltransferase, partial [Coprobacillus sp.]